MEYTHSKQGLTLLPSCRGVLTLSLPESSNPPPDNIETIGPVVMFLEARKNHGGHLYIIQESSDLSKQYINRVEGGPVIELKWVQRAFKITDP